MAKIKILFIASSCSQEKYTEICRCRKEQRISPQQNFCRFLIDGIAASDDVTEIECVSSLPISSGMMSKKNFPEEIERISNKLFYRYLPFKCGKLSRYLSIYRNTKKAVKSWCKKNRNYDKVIICDALWFYSAFPAINMGHRYGVKSIGIVTDLPLLSTNMKGNEGGVIKTFLTRLMQYFTHITLKRYDAYVPLTESINYAINTRDKPYIVVEGSANALQPLDNSIKHNKTVLYAGGICEKYGLKALVDAFIAADIEGWELHIYGSGSFVSELEKIADENQMIKYMGCVTPDEVIEYEKRAMLLVNPRPSNEEFTKYSFPSKTLEYMSSGTPLLTTRLSGIPKEYFDYCYSFDGESVDELSKKLAEILSISEEELLLKGKSAYDFVMREKSNLTQGKRIIEFAKSIL